MQCWALRQMQAGWVPSVPELTALPMMHVCSLCPLKKGFLSMKSSSEGSEVKPALIVLLNCNKSLKLHSLSGVIAVKLLLWLTC